MIRVVDERERHVMRTPAESPIGGVGRGNQVGNDKSIIWIGIVLCFRNCGKNGNKQIQIPLHLEWSTIVWPLETLMTRAVDTQLRRLQ